MESEPTYTSRIRKRIFGFLYCLLWFSSILGGFFIFICPSIIVAFFCPRLYRKWTDLVFGMWEPYPVALMEILFDVRVVMSGDWIDPSEGSIILMNHRTRLDWNFLWAAYYHGAHPHNHSLKYILKAPLMHIPGPGWVMQACSFLFINRCWDKDRRLMTNSLDYLQITEKHCQVLIFPEGTDLTPKSLKKSHKFAERNGLEKYSRVLHPRTTGFVHLVNSMRLNGQLQAVYDFTVGYPKTLAETELDLLKGSFPSEIHFQVTRYDASQIPLDVVELQDWLKVTWQQKEAVLNDFYNRGSFHPEDCPTDWTDETSMRELRRRRRPIVEGVTCQCQNYYAHEIYTIHVEANGANGHQNGHTNGTANGHAHERDEEFLHEQPPARKCRKMSYYSPGNILYLALIFWTTLVLVFFYLVIFSGHFQMWMTFNSIVFATLSWFSDGFHQVLARFNREECLLKKKDE